MRFHLSEDFYIDTDDYSAEGLRVVTMGSSGSGKSKTNAVIAEQILDHGGQIIVIEPVSEWHTLKAVYNNVVVIGGPFQDLPLERDFVGEYIETALQQGINLVVNVGDMDTEEEQRGFVSSFLWSLYRREQRHRKPVFLFLEEADIWAPQMFDKSSKPCRDRVRTIAKRGRKVGIFVFFITQRPADIDKTPTSQCPVQILGKFTAAQDLSTRNGVMFYVKKLGVDVTEKDFMNLSPGEFYVNDVNGFHSVKVTRERKTPHGAETPNIEYAPIEAELAPVLGDLKVALEEAISKKRAEESRIEQLERSLEGSERARERLEQQLKLASDLRALLSGNSGDGVDVAEKIMELEAKHLEEIAGLKETWCSPEAYSKQVERITELEGFAETVEALRKALKPIVEPIVLAALPEQSDGGISERQVEEMIDRKLKSAPRSVKMASSPGKTGIPWIEIWLPKLKRMEQRILVYLAQKYPLRLTKSQIALGTGYSAKGGSFNQSISNLVKWKLLERHGEDYRLAEGPPG